MPHPNSKQSAVRSAEMDLQASLELYAQRITEAEPESEAFCQFRERWPSRFMELCKMHLSMSIDIPVDFFDDNRSSTARASRRRAGSSETTSTSTTARTTRGGAVSRQGHSALRWPIKSLKGLRNTPHQSQSNLCQAGGSSLRLVSNSEPVINASEDAITKNVLLLMDLLSETSCLSSEGLFRKPGNFTRQRVIKQRILSGKPLDREELIDFDESKDTKTSGAKNTRSARKKLQNQRAGTSPTRRTLANAHDLASSLKGVLYELPEPILTKKLLPLYIQVAALMEQHLDDRGSLVPMRPIDEKIITAKQLKALRLLRLLLPDSHAILLERLLRLMEQVLQFTASNRMTADSLGTMFGPSLFAPKKVPARNLQGQYHSFSRLATLMIVQGSGGMSMIPKTFLQDIVQNQRLLDSLALHTRVPSLDVHMERRERTKVLSRCSSVDSGFGCNEGSNSASEADSCGHVPATTSNPEELPALVTCVSFAVRPKCEDPTERRQLLDHTNETEYAVAELCAAIQALPDTDPRKRRLVQRFNATNGGLTPVPIKPVGESAKKNVKFAASTSSITTRTGRSQSPMGVAGSFLRSNNGISAFRAARNIRSSLRQKLAIRSNIHVPTSLRSPEAAPLISQKSASQQQVNIVCHDYSDELPANSPRLGRDSSPIFDTPMISNHRFTQTYDDMTPIIPTKPRVSLNSIASMADNHDVLFCCPLMEVIASPWRKRPLSQEPSMMYTTPVNKLLRRGKKHLRDGVSPSPATRTASSELRTGHLVEDDHDSNGSYAPIVFDEEPTRPEGIQTNIQPDPKTEVDPVCSEVWKNLVQQKLLAFGYRTVAHRNADSFQTLRRSKTMPSLLVPK